eukprot:2661663-Pyramimonas_sp.AAC.1
MAGAQINCAAGAFVGAPCGAAKHVRGAPTRVALAHLHCAIAAFGGAPYGAASRLRGVPGWRGRMLTVPLGPSEEPPYGATNRVRDLRWSFLRGREPRV